MSTTTDDLRNALRRSTGIDDLDWATPPTPLQGGFWAEMYTVELADPPATLAGRLVARIMPDPDTAAFETAIQRHVHRCGFPVPAVRAAGGPTSELDRAWTLMDHAPGQPMLSGLTATGAVRRAPILYRRLPDLLARAAADLHRCPITGPDLDGHVSRADIRSFLGRIAEQALTVGRHDLARIAETLTERAPVGRSICHGDLHPFNLLVDGDDWTILDWSTAVVADPHYDLGFTTLMLANPPLGGPAPVRAVTRRVGGRLARRFLRTYSQLSGTVVDPERLAWGRSVHALRALTEVSTWEHQDRIDAHRGHPWLALRTVLEAQLAT
ncbi:MAG: phosphotransferase [Actinomycetota bacterium]|nr:phosphotransferase [Actinomycetota bacterium]